MSSAQGLLLPNPSVPATHNDNFSSDEGHESEEIINTELIHAGHCLDKASIALTAGSLDDACAHLHEAGDVLEALVSTVILSSAATEVQNDEPPLAMAMAA